MINYDAGEITDLLPAFMKYDSDVQAISYALKRGKEKMLAFSERMKLLRTEQHYSQQKVASLVGIALRSYQYYERGQREPTVAVIIALTD